MTSLAQNFWVQNLGLISSVALPLFNIPLMRRMIQRKSSEDLSLTWVIGIHLCLIGMLPSSLASTDLVFTAFGIANLVLFSGVLYLVIYYRIKNRKKTKS
jgi:uncharacterized protein with PQ loop repeat